MSPNRKFSSSLLLAALLAACSPDGITPPGAPGRSAFADGDSPLTAPLVPRTAAAATDALAEGNYTFFIPADYNGGIFGIDIDNTLAVVARRTAGGEVSGHFSYTQSAGGEDFIFSGSVTCLVRYDTPVLQNFPEIPAGTGNRAKWGALIEESNDPTLPAGGYIWFQSIDNHGTGYPDLSTLSGFGDQAANEAFCNSPNPPNPNFGPHLLTRGSIIVK
jgi:hypothetical protein